MMVIKKGYFILILFSCFVSKNLLSFSRDKDDKSVKELKTELEKIKSDLATINTTLLQILQAQNKLTGISELPKLLAQHSGSSNGGPLSLIKSMMPTNFSFESYSNSYFKYSLLLFGLMNLGNKTLNKIPILGTVSNAMESLFLKNLLASIFIRGGLSVYNIKNGKYSDLIYVLTFCSICLSVKLIKMMYYDTK